MGRASLFVSLLAAASCVLGSPAHGEVRRENGTTYKCKCYADSDCWPQAHKWSALNRAVDGQLQVAVPPAAVCYRTFEGISTYDAAKCAEVQANWANEQYL